MGVLGVWGFGAWIDLMGGSFSKSSFVLINILYIEVIDSVFSEKLTMCEVRRANFNFKTCNPAICGA
jgi:hypothetical protein